MTRLPVSVLLVLFLAASASAAAQSRDVGVQSKPGQAPGSAGLYANSWALVIGINAYMTPEQAVRGLQLLAVHKDRPDLAFDDQGYPDLSQSPAYTNAGARAEVRQRGGQHVR